jgi:ATP-dependent DNA ligase
MERTNNFPHLRDLPLFERFGDTILDGEGIAPVEENTMGETQSMVGASPEHSWERQEEIGLLKYRAFDILKYRGRDLRGMPFEKRRIILESITAEIKEFHPDTTIEILEQVIADKKKFYEGEIAIGREGIMLKDLDAVYGDIHGLIKVKKHIRLTMIITGFKPGAGKHLGKVGSVGIGFFGEKQLTFAGGLSDVLRQDMQDNPKNYLGQVIEIETQEFTTTGSLRHPRVVGTSENRDSGDIQREKERIFRTDKRPEDCGRNQNIKVA